MGAMDGRTRVSHTPLTLWVGLGVILACEAL